MVGGSEGKEGGERGGKGRKEGGSNGPRYSTIKPTRTHIP